MAERGAMLPEQSSGRRRSTLGVLLVLGALGSIALTSVASGPSSASSVTITLYNGQHPQTTSALVSAFEQATGINVAVRNNDEDTFDSEIVNEGARSPADVLYTENSPALAYLEDKGLLASLDKSTLAKTPARFESTEGKWVGVSARVSVIVYNPSLISAKQLPTKLAELASPRYRNELAIAPGESDFQPLVTSMLAAVGRPATVRWLEGLKANGSAHTYPDNETVTYDVNRGLAAFGVIDQYYWYRLRAQIGAGAMHSKLAFFAPRDPGYVIDVSGAAVLRSSHHVAAAQKFVAFLVSAKGQQIIAKSISYEYPIASGVKTSQPERPFSSLQPDPISLSKLGTGAEAVALLRQVQLL